MYTTSYHTWIYVYNQDKVSCIYNKLLCNHNNDDNGSDNSKNNNNKKKL